MYSLVTYSPLHFTHKLKQKKEEWGSMTKLSFSLHLTGITQRAI